MGTVQTCLPALTIEPNAEVPVVQQIISRLRRHLLEGRLHPGDRLPSSRVLARDLGVHFNTVAQAYRALENEGWLELKRRAGTVVLDRQPPCPTDAQIQALESSFRRALQDMFGEYRARGLKRSSMDALIKDMMNMEGEKQ